MNKNNAYTSNENCLFPRTFARWYHLDWNEDMPPYFDRLNEIDDDRSFVILACSVLEYQLDKFLKDFIPKYSVLFNSNSTLSSKIRTIKAFNLIPPHLVQMMDVVRNIRNDFAHNLNIDSFSDSGKSEKLPKHIKEMDELWLRFQNDMGYWSDGKPLRLKYKDIWRVCLEGLKAFEANIRLFRQETEKLEFIENLYNLSVELKVKEEQKEMNSVLKM